jgi:SAM-dependent methyltransferase
MNNLDHLSENKYLRERTEPKPGDQFYLHLSDLLIAMKRVATEDEVKLLDFGCGGSPYRTLFPNAEYKRADIAGVDQLDYEIPLTSGPFRLDVSDSTFDLILSSQVLEHVLHPEHYLDEAYRLLKPGGKLVITTHGIFEDHSCPGDYHRWTDSGLTQLLKSRGFSINETWKITTGPRAALFLFERFPLIPSSTSVFRLFAILWQQLVKNYRGWFHKECDRLTVKNRFHHEHLHRHRLYLGIGLVASKVNP